jgi:hypothetical protein
MRTRAPHKRIPVLSSRRIIMLLLLLLARGVMSCLSASLEPNQL